MTEVLTIPALCRAIETRDGATASGFYAADAVLRVVDQANPPSSAREIIGRDAIAAYYDDVCGRTMTHRVEAAVGDNERLAFTQVCTYPEGSRVVCAAMLELSGGRIARHLAVQAWDP
ncbi:MAG TPA: nuclear transport factor 2 family protein [Rhodopila sp.]|nr:nuclear transport factor 2 family protein [Rhodopila sp.]